MSDNNEHLNFRDWVYDTMEEEQKRLGRYFTEDLSEEDDEKNKPF